MNINQHDEENDIDIETSVARMSASNRKDSFSQDAAVALLNLKAAKQNDKEAQFLLGYKYETGMDGYPSLDFQAFKWYILAAKQNHPEAQHRLSQFYQDGIYVEKDIEAAEYWKKKASISGFVKSQYPPPEKKINLIKPVKYETFIEVSEEGAEEAGDWEGDGANALFEEGWAYEENGNLAKALPLYYQSAEQGSASAHYWLGLLFERGVLFDSTKTKILQHYTAAASAGHPDALHKLGLIHLLGKFGTLKNRKLAKRYLFTARIEGDSSVDEILKCLDWIDQYLLSKDWFIKYVQSGNADVMDALAHLAELFDETIFDYDPPNELGSNESIIIDPEEWNFKKLFGIDSHELYWRAASGGDRHSLDWILNNDYDHDRARLVGMLEKLSEQNNSDAIFMLAKIYDSKDLENLFQDNDGRYYIKRGENRIWTEELARDLYLRAARLGHREALKKIDVLFSSGVGLPNNKSESLNLIREVAELGGRGSLNLLGKKYFYGDGVNQDYTKSHSIFLKAAGLGSTAAQNNLGVTYEKGLGVEKDCGEAAKWFKQAADYGLTTAVYNLARLYETGLVTKPKLNANLRLEMAADLYKSAALKDHPASCYRYGHILETIGHRSCNKGIQHAIPWYKKSSQLGYAAASNRMGLFHEAFENKNLELAASYFSESAKGGDANGQFNFARCLQEGSGIKMDLDQAAAWFERSAEQGNHLAQLAVGKCYENGLGVQQNLKVAEKWYSKAIGDESLNYSDDALSGCEYEIAHACGVTESVLEEPSQDETIKLRGIKAKG